MYSCDCKLIGLALFAIGLMGAARGEDNGVAPQQWLLEQVRVGEATQKDNLIRQSLHRLDLIAPDNAEVLSARIRFALRQGNQAQAKQLFEKLKLQAPDSEAYYQAQAALALQSPEMRQRLEQARLLAKTNHFAEAKAQFDALFSGHFPTLDLAVEYWRLVDRLPDGRRQALQQLQALDRRYPGNIALRTALVRMLYAEKQEAQAFALLRELSTEPNGLDPAADLWFEFIQSRDASAQTVAALEEFMRLFAGSGKALQAQEMLAQQQKQLADPAYRARVRGLSQVDRGKSGSAIPDLKQALGASPSDADLLGALGLAYSRQGNRQRALKQFEQALAAEKNEFRKSKWHSLIASTRYWLALNEGDRALKAGNLTRAQQQYRQAQRLDGREGSALTGLGDVALARGDEAEAERYYQQALRRDPGNGSALRRLVALYQHQSPQKALAYIEQLPPRQRLAMRPRLQGLQVDMLKQQGETLAQKGQWAQAAEKYRQAQRLTPQDVWLNYRLAQALRQAGRPDEADAAMAQLANSQPADPQQVYAYALYLSANRGSARALAHLATLPTDKWDGNLRELYQRLTLQAALDHAQALRDGGAEAAAIAYLRSQPADSRIALRLADWAQARGNYDEALAGYRQVLAKEPKNDDARLGEVEAFVAAGRLEEARQHLVKAVPFVAPEADDLNRQRRVANAWIAVGDLEQAGVLLQRLRPLALQQSPSQGSALLLRDTARFEQRSGRPEAALEDYRQAMVAGGITPTPPKDNDELTRLTRNQPDDDWLKRSIRSNTADLYRQQDTTVTLDHSYWGSSGTPGVSDLQAHTTMLQIDMPLADGRAFLRGDLVNMNAGTFVSDAGRYSRTFGTCAAVGCSSDFDQKAQGTSLGVGWQNERWGADIGTTPLGFDVVDWVGGVHYSSQWRHIGWTATASRRPISSSLLAFGGTRDPNTGITWGGVRATGISLGASYDRGEANGVWSDLGFHQLSGENVADNQRARLMAGYYYKLINESNRRVTVGLNTMLWHYQKDLSAYSLGQGGYYSPQRYFSLGLPVNYRERTENWSWELGGSVSWSRSSTQDQRRYPLSGLVPADLPDRDAIERGSSGGGVGYTLQALVERRLSSHWSVGAGIDIRQAKDYMPSHALLYLRYSLAGWQGDMDLPPQPLTPYAEFK